MKFIFPSYYPDFCCIADACKHTCCTGWEVDVDPTALERFRIHPDIMQHINVDGETPMISMCKNGDCPFLDSDHLCRMILLYGEDMLCDICSDHPRFRNYFSDRIEIGLGLCCESAAELILSQKDRIYLCAQDDHEKHPEITKDESYVLHVRDQLIMIMQNREQTIRRRLDTLLKETECRMPDLSNTDVIDLMLRLEVLEPQWSSIISQMNTYDQAFSSDPDLEIIFEQIAVYFIWRHIAPAAEDDALYGRILLCVFLTHLTISLIFQYTNKEISQIIEICRLVSSNLEYSDENINILIDTLESLSDN